MVPSTTAAMITSIWNCLGARTGGGKTTSHAVKASHAAERGITFRVINSFFRRHSAHIISPPPSVAKTIVAETNPGVRAVRLLVRRQGQCFGFTYLLPMLRIYTAEVLPMEIAPVGLTRAASGASYCLLQLLTGLGQSTGLLILFSRLLFGLDHFTYYRHRLAWRRPALFPLRRPSAITRLLHLGRKKERPRPSCD
jgi:hypothetical protein